MRFSAARSETGQGLAFSAGNLYQVPRRPKEESNAYWGTSPSGQGPGRGGDKYDRLVENPFQTVKDHPLSTFSIDVDTASYANVRRFLLAEDRLPPPDAVRIEELVNYFDYDYAGPKDDVPFAAHIDVADCPWAKGHRLVRVGIKGKEDAQRGPAGVQPGVPAGRFRLDGLARQAAAGEGRHEDAGRAASRERPRGHRRLRRLRRPGAALDARLQAARRSSPRSTSFRRAARPTAGPESSWPIASPRRISCPAGSIA